MITMELVLPAVMTFEDLALRWDDQERHAVGDVDALVSFARANDIIPWMENGRFKVELGERILMWYRQLNAQGYVNVAMETILANERIAAQVEQLFAEVGNPERND